MDKIRDELLSDAIKTALDYSFTIQKLKRVIAGMSITIVLLIIGYFI